MTSKEKRPRYDEYGAEISNERDVIAESLWKRYMQTLSGTPEALAAL